jgi:hypothetical protein
MAVLVGGMRRRMGLRRGSLPVRECPVAHLYPARSRPFDAPKTRKVAVKVINHYGDEVLKVFEVRNL